MTTRQAASVPPQAELEMPAQNLRRYVRERRLGWPSLKTLLARLVTFGGALSLTVYATFEMIAVVSVGIVSVLQWAMVGLFAIAR
jgi:membrane glycosyltransferase